ncbi:uncharacterized protein LOC134764246 [Penaeus indicus]|uniref:uncharacterized protein LOC134764246 n=1 Tax=Penaeus indicus TaxID=29960 RepID=UPI00300C86B9
MSEIKMVELKAKACVAALCVCERTTTPLNAHTPTPTVLPPHTRQHTHSLLLPHPHPHTHPHTHTHAQPQPQLAAPQVKMPSGPHASRIVRKYRRSRLKRVKRQEYKKLRDMVPALQEKPRVSKVEVIEEAIKYIDELHTALIERFRTRGLPATLRDLPLDSREVHGGNIRDLVRHLLATSNPASLPPARIENARTLPSFIQKIGKARRI